MERALRRAGAAGRGLRLPSPPAATVVACIAFIVAIGAQNSVWFDSDMYFIVPLGDTILENGIPYTEPLTMHPELSYTAQQWGYATICSAVYGAFGRAGMETLVALLFACACACVYLVGYGRRAVTLKAAVVIAVFAVATYTFTRSTPRIIDVIVLVLCWYCARRAADAPDDRAALAWAAGAALLTVPFANVHGALWPLPCAVIAASAMSGAKAPHRRMVLASAAAACVPLSMCNPYGYGMTAFPFVSYMSDSFQAVPISEMQAANIRTFAETGVLVLPFAFPWLRRQVRSAAPQLKRRQPTFGELMFIGTWLASAFNGRNTYLFYTVAALLVLEVLRGRETTARPEATRAHDVPAIWGTLFAAIAALGVLLAAASLIQAPLPKEAVESSAAISALQENGVSPAADILCDANDGAFLEFAGYKPYMDARFEVFAPELDGGRDLLAEDDDYLISKRKPIGELAMKYGFDAAVLNKKYTDWTTEPEMERAGFTKVWESDAYEVWLPDNRSADNCGADANCTGDESDG